MRDRARTARHGMPCSRGFVASPFRRNSLSHNSTCDPWWLAPNRSWSRSQNYLPLRNSPAAEGRPGGSGIGSWTPSPLTSATHAKGARRRHHELGPITPPLAIERNVDLLGWTPLEHGSRKNLSQNCRWNPVRPGNHSTSQRSGIGSKNVGTSLAEEIGHGRSLCPSGKGSRSEDLSRGQPPAGQPTRPW